MKLLIVLFSLLNSYGIQAAVRSGYEITTKFSYENKERKTSSESTFILDSESKMWTAIAPPKNGVALLGRVARAGRTELQMEYMIVDTNKENAVISTPAIIAKLGSEARLKIVSPQSEKILVSILAKPKVFQPSTTNK